MKFMDSAALAMKGMSVADIKELNELSKSNPSVIEIAKAGTSLSDIKELISLSEAEGTTPGEAPQEDAGESDQTTPDFKTMYEEQLKKSEELEKKVSEIQKENAGKDLSGNKKDNVDVMLDIFNSTK